MNFLYHIKMQILESYLSGQWVAPVDPKQVVEQVDASTGVAFAKVSSDGHDFAAAHRYAREVGGPSLRAMTFHERATVLRNLGKLLLEEQVKASLYERSLRTGATSADSWIDIDGGAGVLLTYASKARKELPNSHVALDGVPEVLSRDGSFLAAHIYTPRTGVFVQINAFNFPVWGMLEKFAPAFLAGSPSIVKPASQTAHLTEAAVRVMVESGMLPDGSLQLICGSTGDLLDQLDGQDSVGFTGSAATAHLLSTHPRVVSDAVRFTAEADSLNSAVLTPSSIPGTAEFDLFVSEVVKEMTAKAGQKCTAIRRAFVPEALVEEAAAAISSALTATRVGHPATESVEMGPLASDAQVTEVQNALEKLGSAAEIISNSCDYVGKAPDQGAFIAPHLLCATDRWAPAIHETEAFGPVSTLVPYRDLIEAEQLVAAGRGSLVASIYGADPAEVAPLVVGLAAHHGRVLVVDASVAKSSTGHGSPLPNLVHGGPGRAGGGEEMGGMRGVFHHMQRTAIQGSPDQLTTITGELMPGASTREDKGHPFKLTFDDLEIGDSVTTPSRVISAEDITEFAHKTGDMFYAHMDEEAAARSPIFGGIVAHGYLVLSYAAGLFVWPGEGPVLANYGIDKLRFATPTRAGDEIHVVLTCKRKTLLGGRGYGEVAWDTQVINQDGEVAAAYDVLTMVANAPGVNGAKP